MHFVSSSSTDATLWYVAAGVRMAPPRKQIPSELLAHVPPAQLNLPSKDWVALRCADASGQACKCCCKVLRRRNALRHIKRIQLPACPAHREQVEAGWPALLQCLDELGQHGCIVHQLPAFSLGTKGRNRQGQYAAGPDCYIDAVIPVPSAKRYVGVGVELDGPEHDKFRALDQDSKRIRSAEVHGRLNVVVARIGNEVHWGSDIAAALEQLE